VRKGKHKDDNKLLRKKHPKKFMKSSIHLLEIKSAWFSRKLWSQTEGLISAIVSKHEYKGLFYKLVAKKRPLIQSH
jgi:hypothetical protein